MAKKSSLRVMTANRLGDGRVVYLANTGWTGDLDAALLVIDDPAAEAAEREASEAVAARIIVEPYLIDVEEEQSGVSPVRLRERIRADGPTTGNSRPEAA